MENYPFFYTFIMVTAETNAPAHYQYANMSTPIDVFRYAQAVRS